MGGGLGAVGDNGHVDILIAWRPDLMLSADALAAGIALAVL
jgi:hypothetical protein